MQIALIFVDRVEEQHGKCWALRNAGAEFGVSSPVSVRGRNGQNKETEESFFCLLATEFFCREGKAIKILHVRCLASSKSSSGFQL